MKKFNKKILIATIYSIFYLAVNLFNVFILNYSDVIMQINNELADKPMPEFYGMAIFHLVMFLIGSILLFMSAFKENKKGIIIASDLCYIVSIVFTFELGIFILLPLIICILEYKNVYIDRKVKVKI